MTEHRFELWEVTLDGETAQMALIDLTEAPPSVIPRMLASGWQKLRNLETCDPDEARCVLEREVVTVIDPQVIRGRLDELQCCRCDCGATFWAKVELVERSPATKNLEAWRMILADRPCPDCGRVDDVKRVGDAEDETPKISL